MIEQEEENVFQELIHHSDKRKPHGCLALNTLLFFIPIITILFFINIEMPEEPQESGEGSVYQKNSAFMYSNTRTLSPLPLKLPAFADPAQLDSFVPRLSIDRSPQLYSAPPISTSQVKRGSAILSRELLLELPELNAADTPPNMEGEMSDATP